MKLEETICIDRSPEEVFATYSDLKLWPKVLKDIEEVEILYNHDALQEFTMTVTRNGKLETIKAFRILDKPSKIEMFQTTPPPGFKGMSGIWHFTPVDGEPEKTLVRAERVFELVNGGEASFAPKLRELLRLNLESFKRELEHETMASL